MRMILQALAKLYDDLEKRGEISKPGWVATKVGFALSIDVDGKLRGIIPLETEVERNGKKVTVNQTLVLPAPVKRSSGVASNFLWDNSGYVFGVDNKDKPERSYECFKAFRELHNRLLTGVDSDAARGILSFLNSWDPAACDENEVFALAKEDLLKGANLVFRVNGVYAHEDKKIAAAWQNHYDSTEGERIQCLVSGEEDILEKVHPSLKGVKDAQSSGAAIVSFNAEAFCSYGHEQGANAPVGKKAAFAYTTALNYLLADRDNVQHIGDATVVCWADGGKKQYAAFSNACIFGGKPPDDMSEDDLRALVKRLAEGRPCGDGASEFDPETKFYILGLSPNAARISVRFFYRSTFGELMKNVNDHHK
ncbi:MAG: type I-C CRISPR-associated protein Cas8c/Csd1, partial [Clostridia bacterium]|nr:type I-C CRISPR-associated protein Cas8c/Csd1 [Clostridia bacterium]